MIFYWLFLETFSIGSLYLWWVLGGSVGSWKLIEEQPISVH